MPRQDEPGRGDVRVGGGPVQADPFVQQLETEGLALGVQDVLDVDLAGGQGRLMVAVEKLLASG